VSINLVDQANAANHYTTLPREDIIEQRMAVKCLGHTSVLAWLYGGTDHCLLQLNIMAWNTS